MQSAPKAERRFAELRASDTGITGVLLRYGDEAAFGTFKERFLPGALEARDDVLANIMHDRAKPVARIGAGLVLAMGNDTVEARIDWPETVYAREAKELVEARILRGFSIEFLAKKERFEGRTRIIEAATLTGLGIVDRPAYPDSQIAARMWEGYAATVRTRRRRRL